MSVTDEWDEKYYPPEVENKIVGFSGIDPSRKFTAGDKEEIADIAEGVMNVITEIRVGE